MKQIFNNIYPDTVEKIEEDLVKQVLDSISYHKENGIEETEVDKLKEDMANYKIMLTEVSNYYLTYPLYDSFKRVEVNISEINKFINGAIFKTDNNLLG